MRNIATTNQWSKNFDAFCLATIMGMEKSFKRKASLEEKALRVFETGEFFDIKSAEEYIIAKAW